MNHSHSRPGFTITELLVALALIVFIMSILATAFSAASKSVSDLKAANELAEKLRGIMTLLRRDLRESVNPAGHLQNPGRTLGNGDWHPLDTGSESFRGFFRIQQEVAIPRVKDLLEQDWVNTSTGEKQYINVQSSLHFTTFLSASQMTDTFSAQIPADSPLMTFGSPISRENRFQSTGLGNTVYRSRVAEVAWYLIPSGEQTVPHTDSTVQVLDPKPQQLYLLCRRQRLLVDGNSAPPLNRNVLSDPLYREISLPPLNPANAPASVLPNTSTNITIPAMRFAAPVLDPALLPPNAPPNTSLPPDDPRYAALPTFTFNSQTDVPDIVMNDVLSMDVAILLDGSTEFVHLDDPRVQAFNAGNPHYPRNGRMYVFDTWTSGRYGQFDYGAIDDPTTPPNNIPRWRRPGTSTCIPLYRNPAGQVIRIKAIRVTIRIWDSKSQFTRQVSMIQDL
ncbi:MAG: prepilin-type N-terminal cleavage/methylation domain-containing protein [Gemmataceae bacterium]